MMVSEFEMSMIGSLLYVTASRLDVMFSVCLCARFEAFVSSLSSSKVKEINIL